MKKDPYLKKRVLLEKKWGKKRSIFNFIDHWPLYVGKKNLSRYLYILDLIKKINHVKGDICEFGSWKGANVFFISKVIDILYPKNKKKIFSFESFKGMDGSGIFDNSSKYESHNYVALEEEFKDFKKIYNLNRLRLIKGIVEKTIPKFCKTNRKFSLLYHDIHFYEPTRIVLKYFHPRLSIGGYFCFDDWNLPGGEGETRAVNEFLLENKNKYRIILPKLTEQPSIVLKKLRM